MNKPEPKALFTINEEQSANSVCFLVETLPHIVEAIKEADLDDIISNKVETHNPNLMRLYVNSCYDATEVRAYLETLLTETHAAWLVTGDVGEAVETDVTHLQGLLDSAEKMILYHVTVLREVREAARQAIRTSTNDPVLNYIVRIIDRTLEPFEARARATAAAPETSDGDAGAGSEEREAGE